MRQRSPLLLVLVAAMMVTGASGPTARSAATETPRGPEAVETLVGERFSRPGRTATITLVRQPAWVAPEGAAEFLLDIDGIDTGDGVPEPAEVRVIVHRAVTSRGAFRQALAGERLGRVEGRLSVPVGELPADPDGHRSLVLGVEGTTADPQRLVPGRSGVYPVEVELLSRTGRLDGFVTPVVVLANGVVPLTVAWVWPIDATPAHLPTGKVRPAAARAFRPGGRLARMVAAAAEHPDVPLTLAPTPETLEAWARRGRPDGDSERREQPDSAVAGTLTTAQSVLPAVATATRQVLAGPYVPIDVPATLAGDLDTEVDDQFFRGPAVMAESLGPGLSPATVLASALDPAALARLRLYGTERLVLDPAALEAVDQRLTPGHPFLLSGRGKPFTAAVDDSALSDLLDGDDPPGLRVARFLAGLSLVALEAPREPRGVVVVAPPRWDPPKGMLDAALAGLTSHPALSARTLDQFFTEVALETETETGQAVERTLAGTAASAASAAERVFPEVARLREHLAAFSEVVGDDQSIPKAADRSLLIAQSNLLPATGEGSAMAYLSGAERLMGDVTGQVRGPAGARVTLTAREATIPISLLNPTGHPLNVRVRLESDQLRFPDGAERLVTLPPENTTENFKVQTRASGAFPLTILVTSPDGRLTMTRSELTVRSTVVSGVGAMLTAGAGVFLLLWWANDLRRSLRKKRAA